MTLVKTSLWNGIAVVVRMMTMLGLNKILAIYVGPGGYASVGNYQSAIQMLSNLTSGVVNTGVIKYTAEYNGDFEKQKLVWRTAGSLSLVVSITIAVFVLVFREALALYFLKDKELSGVFVWLSCSFVFFVLNVFFMALLNGKKEILHYVVSNIAGSVLAFLAVCLMTMKWGLYGALVALSIYQSLAFIVTFFICKSLYWFKLSDVFGKIDGTVLMNLGGFSAMAITSAICVPVSHVIIRGYIGDTLSWEEAGYWEAIWRMSTAYLMLITTTLSVYYLPRLSELKTIEDVRKEVFSGYKIILPFAALLSFSIYFFREEIINLLFSEEFEGMEVLFLWQVVGDTLKIGSWVLSYVMLSRAMVKLFIFTEIFSSLFFVLATYYLVPIFELEGVALAHSFNYFFYWLLIALLLFRHKALRRI